MEKLRFLGLDVHAETIAVAVAEREGEVRSLGTIPNRAESYHVLMRRPEDIAKEFQNAWNSHEMAALASLFCEDATFVNRFGHYVRGVQAIISLHAPIHETIYSDSTMENEVIETMVLGDGAAVVHCWSRLTVGTAHPAGPHAVDTVILAVLKLHHNGWLIQALENVTLTNPRTGEPVLRT